MNRHFQPLTAFLIATAVSTQAFAQAPTATTTAATSLTNSSAVLNGTGTPEGQDATGWFRYDTTNPGTCNDAFGTRVPATGGTDLGTGTIAVAYSITTTGLTSGTTYYFCAIVSNASGTAFGNVLSFTIPGAPANTTTSAATSVTATAATLNGSSNPTAASTTGYFRYDTTNPGACNDSFGTVAPAGGTALGAGLSAVPFTTALSGLSPGLTYYFCAVANNAYGTGLGSVLTFNTPVVAPVVTTTSATAVVGTTAQLNGFASPGGADTTGWFRYDTQNPGSCDDVFGTRVPITGGTDLGAGGANIDFDEAVSGLTEATTYYFCAVAQNSLGKSVGAVMSFTTLQQPAVTTDAASFLSNTTAVLNGSAFPDGDFTTGWFRYAATNPGTCDDMFGSRAPVSGGTSLGAGNTSIAFSQSISALSPGTTYFYCALASNPEGLAIGDVLSFTTLAPPVTTTEAATAITATTATLNGSSNPEGASTTAWFIYSTTNPGVCTANFGSQIPSGTTIGLGASYTAVPFTGALANLTPNTTYYYCAFGDNSYGTTMGALVSFTTLAAVPVVTTTGATNVTGMTAQLNGAANPGGADTTGWFRYATASPGTCNDTFGTRAPTSSGSDIGSGNVAAAYSQSISGLTPNTTYYYCALASNSVGSGVGTVLTFITPLPPVVTTLAISSLINTAAYLNGTAVPNNGATTGWFRYSTTNPTSCDDVFGTRIPASSGTFLGSGTTAQSFYEYASGLLPGTTYYYCAIASNSEGTEFGAVLSFVTDALPTVTTVAATGITASSVSLNGSAFPNGSDTDAWIRYSTVNPGTCNNSFGTQVPLFSYTDLGSGTTSVPYGEAVNGLSAVTTYYYCAIADNSYGTGMGAVLSFTTAAAAPTVSTDGAAPVTGMTAQLNGTTNPGGADTTGWFRYSTTNPGTCDDTFGTRAPASGGVDAGSGTVGAAFDEAITGLTVNTTYYYCALVSNSVGSAVGLVQSFITPIPPAVTTTTATNISNTTVYLNGTVTPNNATTTAWVRYSAADPGTCDDVFGSRAPQSGGYGVGSTGGPYNYNEYVNGLSAGTTYYFCAIASNSEGTSVGTVQSFTTAAEPSVTTQPATLVTFNSAVLNGSAFPNESETTAWFMYSTTNPVTCNDSFGTQIPQFGGVDLGAGTTSAPWSESLNGLVPATTYYYCAIAQNSYGMNWGSVVSFTTAATLPTVTTAGTTNLTGTTVQLDANVNPNGADATAWFRYDLVSPGTCNDTFGTRAPTSGGADVGSGTTTLSTNQPVSGLTPGTLYYFCAIASNSVGISFGGVSSFITPVPPTVTTSQASNLSETYGYLYGLANPNSGDTTGWFRYDTTNPTTCDDMFGTRVPASGGTDLGAGTTAASFDQYIQGLTAGTTYYFCAIGSNAAGTSFGAVVSFTTLDLPSVTTLASTTVTASGAVLNGSGNPNGAATYGWLRYDTATPGSCNDSFGIRVPQFSGPYLGAGTTTVPYAQTINGLTPNTTYYVCAIANNQFGTGFGAVVTFTTPPAAPLVTTLNPASATGTTATLSGQANPDGADTTAWFRYDVTNPGGCNDTFGTRVPTAGGTDLGSGIAIVPFSQAITGLTAGTTYYYCALASNSVGSATGAVITFTTPLVPVVVTSSATSISNTAAYLDGSANPNNATTTGWFRYATTTPGTCNNTFGSAAPTSGGSNLGAGASSQTYYFYVQGLSPGTTYYFCAVAQNSEGTGYGAILSFTTQAAPTATTDLATLVTATTAVLNGAAISNGADTSGWFRYTTTFPGSCSDSFGTRVPQFNGTDVGSGTTSVAYQQTVTGLTPSTTYYYCAIAQNTYGTAFGAVVSFTTIAAVPQVTTSGATNLTGTTAQLNGTANPGGADSIAWFRYDTASPGTCNDSFGIRTPAMSGTDLGAGTFYVPFSEPITGLTPGVTYYYCALVSNAAGEGVGAVVTFTAPLPPAMTTLAATPITATTATLNGYGNGNGYTATGWLRYDTTNPGSCNDTFGIRVPASSGVNLGTSGSSYAEPLTGLSPGTLYYFCAIGSSAVGNGFGSVLTFTTASTLPTVATGAATGISAANATLNGTATPNGADATAWFRYDTTNPGACNDSFGTRLPASGGTDLGAGNSSVPWTQALTGLSNGVTYYFCAIASNSIGTSFGSVLSFNTAVPTVATQAVTAVDDADATLNGTANPNSTATTGWFRYSAANPGSCSDTFGTRTPASGGTNLGAGAAAVPYSAAISGLSAATTYYYCAIASSSSGTGFGSLVSFSTAGPPTVATNAVNGLDSTDATLNGSATGNSADTTAWFRYDTMNPGSCNDTFGTRTPASGGTDVGTGSTAIPYTASLSSLTPGATYYACAIASNTYGTSTGSVVTFTTPAAPPTASTVSGTGLTGTTAQLDGSANPGGSDAGGWFRYDSMNPGTCDDVFGTPAPAMGDIDLGAGNASVAFSQTLSALIPGTTYYFCAIAQNSVSKVFGSIMTFTTPVPPVVVTTAASAIANTSATLNGTGDPGGAAATGWFRYDVTNPGTCNDSFGTLAPASGGSPLGTGTSPVAYSQAVTGLAQSTTYYYCAIASTGAGEGYGAVLSFVTDGPPQVTTNNASSVSSSAAVLNGLAAANGADTTGWFRYDTMSPGSCDDVFGTRVPASGGTDLGSSGTTAYTQSISGLTPGTTYFACALASNSYGAATGTVVSFTTAPSAPAVTTVDAIPLSGSSAQFDGTANPGSGDTTAWFRYDVTNPGSCNNAFGTRAPASGGTDLGSGNSSVPFSQTVLGLAPGATYYVCAIASNASGTAFGAVLTFVSPVAPIATTLSASPVTDTTATLNGKANPKGTAATGWFRYDVVNPGTCDDSFGTRAPASSGTALGSGSATVAYSQAITGLSPLTTYYFCAIASGTGGLSVGTPVMFMTPSAPTVATLAASSITSATATLNGSAAPNSSDTTGWFRYDVTNPGACDDVFGTRAPASGGTDLGTGAGGVAYAQAISGLTPGTTYYVCAIASNAYGTGTGSVVSFTASGAAPTVSTVTGAALTGTTAQLDGSANADGADTTGWFRYSTVKPANCNDTFGTRTPASGGTDVGSGTTAAPFTQTISSLTAGTAYYFCAIGSNSFGTAFGALQSFTMPTLPAATTKAASAVANTSATLNGTGNPGGSAATGWFRYDVTNPGTCNDTFGTLAPASGGSSLGAGNAAVAFSQAVTGLSPQTTYYYCAIDSNAAGEGYGSVLSFATGGAPAVTTSAASSVLATSAVLNGSAIANGADTTGWFRYDTTNPGACSDSFGTRAPAGSGTDVGSGGTSTPYTQSISGLTPGTAYYACAIASNAYGLGTGTVVTFTTPAAKPSVSTVSGTPLTGTSAQLDGSANPDGADTTGWFRYDTANPASCDDVFGTSSAGTDLGTGNSSVPFTQTISGLMGGTTYYFCAIASNSFGKVFGAIQSFTMPPVPVVQTLAATAVVATSATLNGSADPGGAAATGWFRYDVINPGTCSDTFGTAVPTAGGSMLGSGTAQVPYSQSLSGLSPLTTYYFCAIASNSAGEGYGSILSFTTGGAPTVTTKAATLVTAATATLNGSAIANGSDATGWFRYDTTNPGSCNDAFGTRTPAGGGTDLGSGSTGVAYSQAISGLSAGTAYYFCALASNAFGLSTGSVLTFTTPASLPTVTTVDGNPLSGTTAQLDGLAYTGGGDTTGWFRYSATNPKTCNDTFGVRAPATGGDDLGSGSGANPFGWPIANLTPGTTYFVCAIASNASGTSVGAVVSFTAPLSPTVQTKPASTVVSTSAALNGTANPNGTDTTGWFRYDTTNPGSCSDTFGTRIPSSGGTDVGSGASAATFSETPTVLAPATTYFFCALASNIGGLATGTVLSFTTPSGPAVTTTAATMTTASGTTLNGTATPNGADATGWFRYDVANPGACSDSFGTRVPATGGTDLGSGMTAGPWSQAVTGLLPGTKYFFCALASNAYGSAAGAVLTFTTPAALPVVTTVDGTALSGTTVQLDGSANPGAGDTTGWFRYDTTNPGTCGDGFGTRVPASGGVDTGSGTSTVAYSETASALAPGTKYFLCAIASNASGTAFGAVMTFTTPVAPTVVTNGSSSVSNVTATLNGSANPSGTATTGWFRYATTNPGACSDAFGTRLPVAGGVSLGMASSSQAFSESAAALLPATTYYFCALASNTAGLATGTVLSFTTQAAPTVLTSPATVVTASSATLNGSGNPNGNAATAWFRYDTTNPGSCDDTFGTRAPVSGGAPLGSGTSAVVTSQAISGLMPATKYFACALASNAYGTSTGQVVSFTTSATAPTVTTDAASLINGASAQLNATANPGGADTTGWFRYDTTQPSNCTDHFGTRVPASGGTDLSAGDAAVAFSQAASGLATGQTYFYCALASNSAGTSFGAVLSFSTLATPIVTTTVPTQLTSMGATFNATVNPEGSDATAWFRYDTTMPAHCDDSFGTRIPASGGQDVGSGVALVGAAQSIAGLAPGTAYFYCALAANTAGESTGTVLTFTTPAAAPTVVTSSASMVSGTTAQLNGTSISNGADTTGWFRYDTTNPGNCTDAFGTRMPQSGGMDLGPNSSSVFSQTAADLQPSTRYFYCAIASNSAGVSFGGVVSFKTSQVSLAPDVTSVAASAVTSTTATLNGLVNPEFDNATAWFRYSAINPNACDDNFGTRIPASGGTSLPAGGDAVEAAEDLTALSPSTTWYFCAIASNSTGTSFGAVLTFNTSASAPSVITSPPTSLSGAAGTLNGAVNSNGSDSTAWFRYDTTNPGSCNDSFGERTPGTGGMDVGSGTAPVPFSDAVSDLLPAATYYACAIATNGEGTSFGDVVTFTPGIVAPTVTTTAATDVMGTSATITGTVNPEGYPSAAWFRLGTTMPTTCSDAFGQRVPSTDSVAVPAGTAVVPVIEGLNGLSPSTMYYFCAAASNSGGAVFGDVLSFSTPASLPTVTTAAAALGDNGNVTLDGTANPNGADTTAWFRAWNTNPGACSDTFGTRFPAMGGQDVGPGTLPVPFSDSTTSLTSGTWFVCAIASNSAGTAFGTVQTLVVPTNGSSSRTKSGCGCDTTPPAGEAALWLLAFARMAWWRRRSRMG